MGLIRSYRIVGRNLFLTEEMSWTFAPDDQEAVQEWELINVDEADLKIHDLDELISYGDNSEFEQQKIGNKIKVSLFNYFNHSEYFFNCESISSKFRPLNIQELNAIIIESKNYVEKLDAEISKHRNIIEELEKYLAKEMDRKNRIIEEITSNSNESLSKAKYQLDSLLQIKNYLDAHR